MKNAYKILGISQNANSVEIVKGQVLAMKEGKYSPTEIANAKKQLSTPTDRLAVDFTFPVVENQDIPILTSQITSKEIDLKTIDFNVFDTLK